MNYILIILLILCVLIASLDVKNKAIESFKTESMEWGYNPINSMYHWDDALTQKIVGPNPNSNIVDNWQYNPENTQVDYKYYKDNHDMRYESTRLNLNTSPTQNKIIQHLAPVTWGKIGKDTSPMDEIVPVMGQETRVPDSQSSFSQYVIPSPSAPGKYNGPNVNYCW